MVKKLIILSFVLLALLVGHSVPVTGRAQTDSDPASHFESYENVEFLGYLQGSFGVIEVHGDYAYTGCPGGLCVIDVSDPRRPEQISFTEIPIGISQIVIDGDYLYANQSEYCCDPSRGVIIVNIKDPSDPTIVNSIDLDLTSTSAWVSDLDIHAHRNLYISLMHRYGVDRGVSIVDVSDPLQPAEIGFIDVRPNEDEAINGLSINGDTATILHGKEQWYFWIHGLARYEISNPLKPVNLGRIEPSFEGGKGGQDITVQGDRAYVVNGDSVPKTPMKTGGLTIYDISNPPEIDFLGGYGEESAFYEFEVMGNYAYLSGSSWDWDEYEYTQWMNILSVYDPKEIGVVGYLKKSKLYGTTNLSQKDGTIYLTDSKHGLYILRYAISETLTLDHGGGLFFEDPIGMTYFVHAPEVAMIYPTDLYFAPIPGYISSPGYAQVGDVFELSAYQDGMWLYGFPFATRINIEIKYNDELLDLVTDESQLTLRWWNGAAWVDAAETCTPNTRYLRDLENSTLWLPVCEIGRFGLFGPTETLFLPVVSK